MKKVLIVDDEPNIVLALEYLLHRSGYQTRVASNGEEAMREIDAFRPDVILLDVMMPQLSGYDVCRRVRERGELGGMKIVMLSAKGREAEVSKGLALGADLYVTKPFSNADLVERIGKLLSERRAPGDE